MVFVSSVRQLQIPSTVYFLTYKFKKVKYRRGLSFLILEYFHYDSEKDFLTFKADDNPVKNRSI